MNKSITLQDSLNKLREYDPEEVEIIKWTNEIEWGPYISHSLNVSYILTNMHIEIQNMCYSFTRYIRRY